MVGLALGGQTVLMARTITAPLGPIQRADDRASVVERLVVLRRVAAVRGCDLPVYSDRRPGVPAQLTTRTASRRG